MSQFESPERPSPALFVVTGAGPVGWTVAEQLAAAGHRVRVLTRSGSGPDHPLIEKKAVDVSDPAQLGGLFRGAKAVFHCIHGSKYSAKAWAAELPGAEQAVLAAAGEAGAVVVFPESLYSYSEPDRPMTEEGPRRGAGRQAGCPHRAAEGPRGVGNRHRERGGGRFLRAAGPYAHAGERMVRPVAAGKPLQVVGRADQPHSFTYVPDLAAAMIVAADKPNLWNRVWHAPTGPALTQRELAGAFATAAGARAPRVTAIPGWALKAMGVLSPGMRELAETLYQFERPFVMDSRASKAALGLQPTPLKEAAAATVAWWGDQER